MDKRSTTHQSENEQRFTLAELTELAGVSTRTVRYYITEGLLPPPIGGGPKSAYSHEHLDRLRLIARYKDEFLPLREIRRRLDALKPEEVHRLAQREVADTQMAPPAFSQAPVRDERSSAKEYLAAILKAPPEAGARPPQVSAPLSRPPQPRGRGERHEMRAPSPSDDLYLAEAPMEMDFAAPPPRPRVEKRAPPAETDAGTWRRIPISDDAELLVRESAVDRLSGRLEWLVTWARKVFH